MCGFRGNHVLARSEVRVLKGAMFVYPIRLFAHIAEVWPMLTQSVRIGVVDVGFGTNDDLHIVRGLNLPSKRIPTWVANHGTHVAGIMCAQP
jgi:hypothetical protein